jgi:hypothetical protein
VGVSYKVMRESRHDRGKLVHKLRLFLQFLDLEWEEEAAEGVKRPLLQNKFVYD